MSTLNISATLGREAARWTLPIITTVVLIGLVLVIFRDTGAAMVEIWERSGDYTHAYVVPPIALWLVWRMREQLKPLTPRPAPVVLIVMAALVLLWWVADQVAVNAATQLSLMGLVVASVPLVLGWQVTRAMLFPLAFLFFAVPVGDFMTPYLMKWTAVAAVAGLRWTGIPVYQEGQLLIIPSGQWLVVEACGGIRYLMSTLMAGALFAYLNYRSTKRRLLFMLLALVVPIVANWMRAYMIIMIGHLSGNTLAVGVDHLLYGWVFFGIVVFALFAFGARWSEPDAEPDAKAAAALRHGGAGAAPAPAWWPPVVALLAVAVLQLPMWWLDRQTSTQVARAPVSLQPLQLGGNWRARPAPSLSWTPSYSGAAAQLNQAFAGADGEVVVNLQYYRGQNYGAKLVSSENAWIRGKSDWQINAQGLARTDAPVALQWNRAHIAQTDYARTLGGSRQHLLGWQVYWIGGHLTHSQVEAKLWQGWLALTGQPDDAAAIILFTPGKDQAAGDARLRAFVEAELGPILKSLDRTRAVVGDAEKSGT